MIATVAGPLGGLSAAEVARILDHAEATANVTRSAIRLPLGSRTRMVIAVADLDGTVIGLRRMPDATVFSIDVAVTKARNMVYFNSGPRTATDFFPGSTGLYRNGTLVGGLGVSGDGVDEDDYAANGGTAGFEALAAIRADQVLDEGARLPYFKFPRNPTN